jgi:hypothetical protein
MIEQPHRYRFFARFLLTALLAAIVAVAATACGKKDDGTPDAAAAVDMSPVAAPEGVLAELYLSKPDETWKRMRALAGGAAMLLPASYPMLVTSMLGLAASVAGSIDPDVPTVGVVTSTSPEQASVVLAIHVKSGRELVAALSTGNDPMFRTSPDAASGITLLDPILPRGKQDLHLGVLGNYLIAASTRDELVRAGPFAARTLPTRDPKADGLIGTLEGASLKGPIASTLRNRWKRVASELDAADRKKREQEGGRAPDFGDPKVALGKIGSTVEELIASIESSRRGRVSLVPLADRLDARIELEAEPGGALARALEGMVIGDLEPLLAMPNSTDLALFDRTSPEAREQSARSLAEGMAALLGERLAEPDRKRIARVTEELAKGRGDTSTYALLSTGDKSHLVYSGAAADPKRLNQGIEGLLELPKLRGVADPLREFIGELSVKRGTAEVSGLDGKAQRATITIKPKKEDKPGAKPDKQPKTYELYWVMAGDRLHAALSEDPAPALAELANARGSNTLGVEPRTAAAAKRIGGAAGFALFADPVAFMAGKQKASAPLLLVLGKEGNVGWLRLDADRAAVQVLAGRLMNL